jgi:hypothetical protein
MSDSELRRLEGEFKDAVDEVDEAAAGDEDKKRQWIIKMNSLIKRAVKLAGGIDCEEVKVLARSSACMTPWVKVAIECSFPHVAKLYKILGKRSDREQKKVVYELIARVGINMEEWAVGVVMNEVAGELMPKCHPTDCPADLGTSYRIEGFSNLLRPAVAKLEVTARILKWCGHLTIIPDPERPKGRTRPPSRLPPKLKEWLKTTTVTGGRRNTTRETHVVTGDKKKMKCPGGPYQTTVCVYAASRNVPNTRRTKRQEDRLRKRLKKDAEGSLDVAMDQLKDKLCPDKAGKGKKGGEAGGNEAEKCYAAYQETSKTHHEADAPEYDAASGALKLCWDLIYYCFVAKEHAVEGRGGTNYDDTRMLAQLDPLHEKEDELPVGVIAGGRAGSAPAGQWIVARAKPPKLAPTTSWLSPVPIWR